MPIFNKAMISLALTTPNHTATIQSLKALNNTREVLLMAKITKLTIDLSQASNKLSRGLLKATTTTAALSLSERTCMHALVLEIYKSSLINKDNEL